MSDATRKIAVIVALDVAGYSARTEADEAKTAAEVAALRQVIEGIAKAHGGRVFNTAGDGFMLEFASSLAAVEAAQDLAARCEPKVRVGVHLGDVVVQPNGDLLGHGVNVAARLMAKSDPGAALISADVRRTIRGPLAERLVSRGLMQLDKMTETIEAFALAAAASAFVAAPPKTAEPLLAVLPFDNLSNDPEMQFFSDGVAEEILQAIARGSKLQVIGRTSAFQFRGERKGEAARVLKATHVLDGAVRRSGAHMRVSAQLTEAASSRLLWTQRYDRNIAGAFELQDDIAAQVTAALNQTLSPPNATTKIDPVAYDLYLRAKPLLAEGVNSDLVAVEAMLAQAASRAPDAADIWALLARVRTHFLPSDRDSLGEPMHEAARVAAHHALTLDPNSGEALVAEALLKPAFAKHGEKLRLAERAYLTTPNGPLVAAGYAGLLQTVGRCEAALPIREHAARLEPLSTMKAIQLAGALSAVNRVEDSIAVVDDAWRRLAHTSWLAIARLYFHIGGGRLDDAERIAQSGEVTSTGQGKLLRELISVLRTPLEQREGVLSLHPQVQNRSSVLNPGFCTTLAFAGCDGLALDLLLEALNSGRSIGLVGQRGSRAAALSPLFDTHQARALQRNIRFPRLCARVGLVDYWRESGHWPDCATQVPYDFKAECERAAAEAEKA